MRILITGASGFFAHSLIRSTFCDLHDLILVQHKKRISCDKATVTNFNLTHLQEVVQAFERYRPDLVIHAAAITSVEKCESEKELAFLSNVTSTANIAYACNKLKAKMVHISTDHLFDGLKKYYKENDSICPLNYYAYTKGLAEMLAASISPTSLIVRTNFFGVGMRHHNSFAVNILNQLFQKQKVYLFTDVYFSPVIIDELLMQINILIDQDAFGIYNISSNESISKYEFGVLLAKYYQLDSSLIVPTSFDSRTDLVVRPKNMSLDNNKMLTKTYRAPPSILDQIGSLDWRV